MAYSYAQLQEIKSRIIQDLATQQNSLQAAKAQFAIISANLTNMQTQYTGWAGEVNAMAAASPNDNALKALKAERDLLVSEFASTKTEADNLNTAVNT